MTDGLRYCLALHAMCTAVVSYLEAFFVLVLTNWFGMEGVR